MRVIFLVVHAIVCTTTKEKLLQVNRNLLFFSVPVKMANSTLGLMAVARISPNLLLLEDPKGIVVWLLPCGGSASNAQPPQSLNISCLLLKKLEF